MRTDTAFLIKKIVVLSFAAICLMFSLAACSGNNAVYESVEEFESHFISEEYDSEYSTITEVFTLKEDTDYQVKLDAKCESGTMKIRIMYAGADEKVYSVDSETPCNEILTIPTDSVNEVEITVSIEPDTNGTVIGRLLAHI